jgi:hypothetical protein
LYLCIKMSDTRRSGFRWTINEILTLQREYELLELPIHEIADRHERSFFSILNKLKSEEFIDDKTYHSEVMKNRHNVNEEFDNTNETSTYISSESNADMSIYDERINFLESTVNDIRETVSKLLTSVYGNKEHNFSNEY